MLNFDRIKMIEKNKNLRLKKSWRIMNNLIEFIKRHQLIAYFVLTYAFSWALWIPIQPLVLDGHDALVPLITLGIFGPALVAIGLSAIINPRPKEGNRNRATITFIVVWIISALIIVSYYVTVNRLK